MAVREVRRSFILVAIVIDILFVVHRVNSDLTLYITRRFAVETLNFAVKNDIVLLQNGKPNPAFHDGEFFSQTTRLLSPSVLRVEMKWFPAKNPVRYSLLVTSSNLEIMQQPRVTIPLQGVVKGNGAFQISLPCSGLVHGTVNVKFVLNHTNYKGANLDRSSKRTLQFTMAKLCDNTHESSTEATHKKNIDRTIIVSVCAVLACVICLLVGLVFFRRFVKRIRKKFGFDEVTESPLFQESHQSTNTLDSNSQVPTVVYSPKGNGFRKTFFAKIAKWEERKHENSLQQTNSCHCSRFSNAPPASEPLSVNSTSSAREHFVSRDGRGAFSQVSIGDDDVFVAKQTGKVALIRNEHSVSSLTLAKESDSKNDMYSTLNEYWASQLGDSLIISGQEVDVRSEVIAEGAFCRVLRGKLRRTGQEEACGSGQTPRIDLAVKVCQDGIEFEQMVSFVNEAILMKGLDHANLINLLGVVLQPASPPLILMPLLSHGDLHKFLRHSRGIGSRRQLIGSRQLINFATQIARGMEYLSNKKVVHRDLAARNCFVDKDLNVKIGDFSLAKNIHQFNLQKMEHPTQLSVKWLALESLLYYMFTEKSDIWSFGIVLWELVTLGAQPYAGLDNYEVMPYLETGKRLSRPLRCPDDLFAIMYSCWLASADERPTFSILVHKLEDYEVRLRPSCIAFEFDEDTIEMNDGCENF